MLAGPASPASAAACGSDAVADPLIQHINSAHLERSPVQQLQDLIAVDSYVLAHTVLVQSVLAPLLPTIDGIVEPFEDHVEAAHLERSPINQARDLVDADDYVLAHTVLVESMLAPELEGCADGAVAAPATPAHGSTPAPAPAPPAPAAPAPAATAVEIHDYAFGPKDVSVPAGSTVTWTNHDDDTHTVTGTAPFRSRSFGKDATYSFTFAAAGTYRYVCALHPQMKGSVTVS